MCILEVNRERTISNACIMHIIKDDAQLLNLIF